MSAIVFSNTAFIVLLVAFITLYIYRISRLRHRPVGVVYWQFRFYRKAHSYGTLYAASCCSTGVVPVLHTAMN